MSCFLLLITVHSCWNIPFLRVLRGSEGSCHLSWVKVPQLFRQTLFPGCFAECHGDSPWSLLLAGITTLRGKNKWYLLPCPTLALTLRAEFRKAEIEERLWSALQLRDSPQDPPPEVDWLHAGWLPCMGCETAGNSGGMQDSAPSWAHQPACPFPKGFRDNQWQQIQGRDEELQEFFSLAGEPPACPAHTCGWDHPLLCSLQANTKEEGKRLKINSGR